MCERSRWFYVLQSNTPAINHSEQNYLRSYANNKYVTKYCFKLLSRELWPLSTRIFDRITTRAREVLNLIFFYPSRHLNIQNAPAYLSVIVAFQRAYRFAIQKPFRFCDNLVHFIVRWGGWFRCVTTAGRPVTVRVSLWYLRETAKGHIYTHTLFEYVKYYINELTEVD